jgi:hypothetical protein
MARRKTAAPRDIIFNVKMKIISRVLRFALHVPQSGRAGKAGTLVT